MEISTMNVKEYNVSRKVVLIINETPICVAKPNRINKLIQYAFSGLPVPFDGKIKKHIDYFRKIEEERRDIKDEM